MGKTLEEAYKAIWKGIDKEVWEDVEEAIQALALAACEISFRASGADDVDEMYRRIEELRKFGS